MSRDNPDLDEVADQPSVLGYKWRKLRMMGCRDADIAEALLPAPTVTRLKLPTDYARLFEAVRAIRRRQLLGDQARSEGDTSDE